MKQLKWSVLVFILIVLACDKENQDPIDDNDNCISSQTLDDARGNCGETLNFLPRYSESVQGNNTNYELKCRIKIC